MPYLISITPAGPYLWVALSATLGEPDEEAAEKEAKASAATAAKLEKSVSAAVKDKVYKELKAWGGLVLCFLSSALSQLNCFSAQLSLSST